MKRAQFFVVLLLAPILATSGWVQAYVVQWGANATLFSALAIAVIAIVNALLSFNLGEVFSRERRSPLMDLMFQDAWKRLQTHDPNVRVSVALCSLRAWWGFIPIPGFRTVWSEGFKQGDPDLGLKLFRFQGVSGAAVRQRKWAIGVRFARNIDGDEALHSHIVTEDGLCESNMDRLMTGRQRAATQRLRFVLSYPIWMPAKNTSEDKSEAKRIIGVINLDSPDLLKYYDDKLNRNDTTRSYLEQMKHTAVVAGYIFG